MAAEPCIVALAARCAVGLSAEASAAAIRAGVSRITEHPVFVDAACERLRCAVEPRVPRDAYAVDRMIFMVDRALRELITKLFRKEHATERLPLLLALPEQRPGFGAEHAARMQRALLRSDFPGVAVQPLPHHGVGHAGALCALETAMKLVERGDEDLCVVGGVDSYFEYATLDWLESRWLIKREGTRSGFAPGEAVALIAIASERGRRRLQLPALARITGIQSAVEERPADGEEGLLGEALTRAIVGATGQVRRDGQTITDLYGDINGERERTHDWGFALLRASDVLRDGTDYVSAVGQCGDVGAATAALGCVLAVRAWSRGYAHGPRAMVWAGSWGGLRAAAVLEQAGT